MTRAEQKAKHKQAERQRKKDAGLYRFEAWIPSDKLPAVREAIARITGENDA